MKPWHESDGLTEGSWDRYKERMKERYGKTVSFSFDDNLNEETMEPVKFDMGEGRMFQGYTGISYIEKYIEYLRKFDIQVQISQLENAIEKSGTRLEELIREREKISKELLEGQGYKFKKD